MNFYRDRFKRLTGKKAAVGQSSNSSEHNVTICFFILPSQRRYDGKQKGRWRRFKEKVINTRIDLNSSRKLPTTEGPGSKRTFIDLTGDASSSLPPCKYGAECYRKNPAHFKEFSHPDPATKLGAAGSSKSEVSSSHELGAGYGFYLVRVPGIKYGSIPTITLAGKTEYFAHS